MFCQIIGIIAVLNSVTSIPVQNTNYYRLRRYLTTNYDDEIRPVLAEEIPTNITIFFMFTELLSVDEALNVVSIAGLLELYWKDQLLHWNPGDYGNITETVLEADSVWIPLLVLYNSSNSKPSFPADEGLVELKHTGEVEYSFPVIFHILCPINVRYFPWDVQTCNFDYGPAQRLDNRLNLKVKHPNRLDLSGVLGHQEWLVTHLSNQVHKAFLSDEDEFYTFVRFAIVLERKPLFFIYTLIVPSALIVFLAILALFSPYNSKGERQEKFRVGLSAFTTLLVVQLIIVRSLPRSGEEVPIIGVYFTVQLFILFLAILSGSLILQLQQHRKKLPSCLKTLSFNYLIHCLPFVERVGKKEVSTSSIISKWVQKEMERGKRFRKGRTQETVVGCNGVLDEFLEDVRGVLDHWPAIVDQIKKDIQKKEAEADWQSFLNILERCFMFVFLLAWLVIVLLLVDHRWY